MASPLQVIQIPSQPGFIDFGNGEPALTLLPIELLRQAAESAFEPKDPAILQYGTEQGNGYFRQALAGFLTRGYGFPVQPQDLFVTNGASMGLHLVCSLFTHPGDTVFVEEPTYFLALRILADHGLQVVPIETDEQGLKPDSLEEALRSSRPAFLYLIPTFQNPSGRTLPEARRQQIARLSREHGFIIAADEVYHFLDYQQAPPAPMAAYSGQGNVISINSFSKILAPGLRLGWIQTDPERIRRFITFGLLDSGGGMNPFTSAIARYVIESGGLAANISHLQGVYSRRVQAMDECLRHYLPQAEFVPPLGGYFFWLRLAGIDSAGLLQQARSYGVSFHSGRRFSSRNGLAEWIRLSYVNTDIDEIEEGTKRLAEAVNSSTLH
jgi:2-aminoadipate transaminase